MAFPFEQTCHQEGCKLKTRGMDATCIDKCNRMLCPKHRKAPYHECLTLDVSRLCVEKLPLTDEKL